MLIKRQRKNKEFIKNEDKIDLTKDNSEKAEVLAGFFSSVFTKEPKGHWDLPERGFIHNSQVDLSKEAVHKVLTKLKISCQGRMVFIPDSLCTLGYEGVSQWTAQHHIHVITEYW